VGDIVVTIVRGLHDCVGVARVCLGLFGDGRLGWTGRDVCVGGDI